MSEATEGQTSLTQVESATPEPQEPAGSGDSFSGLVETLNSLNTILRNLTPRDFQKIKPPDGPAGPYDFYQRGMRWLRLGRREFALTHHSPMAAPGGFNGSSGLAELLREPWTTPESGEASEQKNRNAEGWREYILDPVPTEEVIVGKVISDTLHLDIYVHYTTHRIDSCLDACLACLNSRFGGKEAAWPQETNDLLILTSVLCCLVRASIKKGGGHDLQVAELAIAALEEINRKAVYGSLDEEIVLERALLTKAVLLHRLLRRDHLDEHVPSVSVLGTCLTLLEQGLRLRNFVLQHTSKSITKHYYGNLRQVLIQILANEYSRCFGNPRADILIRMAKAFLREMPESMRNENHYKYRYHALELFCSCLAPDQAPLSKVEEFMEKMPLFPGDVNEQESFGTQEKLGYRKLVGTFNWIMCQAALYRTAGWCDCESPRARRAFNPCTARSPWKEEWEDNKWSERFVGDEKVAINKIYSFIDRCPGNAESIVRDLTVDAREQDQLPLCLL